MRKFVYPFFVCFLTAAPTTYAFGQESSDEMVQRSDCTRHSDQDTIYLCEISNEILSLHDRYKRRAEAVQITFPIAVDVNEGFSELVNFAGVEYYVPGSTVRNDASAASDAANAYCRAIGYRRGTVTEVTPTTLESVRRRFLRQHYRIRSLVCYNAVGN